MATNPFLTSLPSPKPDILAPAGLDFNTGTAEILRLAEVRSAVTSDFVVLPCDLVCELGGDKLLQAWMVKSASLADVVGGSSPDSQHSGGLAVWYETKSETPIKGQETDFVAVVPAPARKLPTPPDSVLDHVSKVVCSMPTNSLNDLVQQHDGLPLRHALLHKHPRIRMLTSHRDAHIYILPRWVMDFVNDNSHFDTIGEDVLGWWAKATWQRGLPEKLGLRRVLTASEPAGNGTSTREGSQSPTDSPGQVRVKSTPTSARAVAPVQDKEQQQSRSIDKKQSKSDDIPQLMAYIQPKTPSAPLIRRVDNAQLLLSTSLQLAKLESVEEVGPDAASPFAHARKVAYPSGVRPRTTITQADSLVADNVTVQEKTSIKETVVGANCQIGEGAKLMQCLLMDGVVVGKNCRLTKCILGRRSDIGDGCVLTECEVQENLLVEPKSEFIYLA